MPAKQEKSKPEVPNDLYNKTLSKLVAVESQIVEALPKVIAAVKSPDFKTNLEAHLEETKIQKERLDSMLGMEAGQTAGEEKSEVLQALFSYTEEILGGAETDPWLDIKLAMVASKIEHFEMSLYTSACTLAETTGNEDALANLQMSLQEEMAAAKKVEGFARTSLGLPDLPSPSTQNQGMDTSNQSDEQKSQQEKETMPRGQERESQRGGSSMNRERDEQGRFTSSRDDGERSGGRDRDREYSGRSRGDDGGRGEGRGWYGDSQGHSEAAREGWEHRGGGGSRGGMQGRGGGGRDDDDDRGGSRGGRGGSNYSRGSNDDDDRGGNGEGRGWYGDSQGHSEAASEGWRNRDR